MKYITSAIFIGINEHSFSQYTRTPKVMIEWLAFLLRIWEVPSSNPGLITGYPGCGFFVVFLSFFRLMPV
jgi:hypothetical protein